MRRVHKHNLFFYISVKLFYKKNDYINKEMQLS